MRGGAQQPHLREVLHDIIEGRTVKRGKHDLRWNQRDLSTEFVDILQERGYIPTTVEEVNVQPGQRVPAFSLGDGTAYFGWIFWEKFSESKLRKLFGSAIRNDRGDWAIQIPPSRKSIIYANASLVCDMDIDNPSGF
jgi:hypothetical protein